MQKLYKQFEEWATKLRLNNKADDFFRARLGLTVFYLITAIIILGGSSIIMYNVILSNLTQSILDRGFDPNISQEIISDAQAILLNRFITIDSIIILFTVILGFWLTVKTLKPIKINMLKQKRFIADASHELRTPIAVVVSGLEVALSNKKLDFPTAKKTLEETLEGMKELIELSNDLLDISKYNILSSDLKYEHIRIDEKLKRISEKNRGLAKLKGIKIEVKAESPAHVLGNKIELARVLYNVLDNAIKYTSNDGQIKILGEVKQNKYEITVSDSGSGISKEAIKKVFNPFFREDKARNTSGAGLGLTLTKKIIENHHGTIAVKSEVDKGTNVIITLPISSP